MFSHVGGIGSSVLPQSVPMHNLWLHFGAPQRMLMTWVLRGQAGPPLCMDQLFLFLRFFRQVVCHALQRHTALSLHLPLFLEETFYPPCFLTFNGMQIAHGQWVMLKGFQTTVATKEYVPNALQDV